MTEKMTRKDFFFKLELPQNYDKVGQSTLFVPFTPHIFQTMLSVCLIGSLFVALQTLAILGLCLFLCSNFIHNHLDLGKVGVVWV